jgi:hypothetical protein
VGGFLILIGVAGLVIGGIATANSAIRALHRCPCCRGPGVTAAREK